MQIILSAFYLLHASQYIFTQSNYFLNIIADTVLASSSRQRCREPDASHVGLLRQFGVSAHFFHQQPCAKEICIVQWQSQRAVADCCQEMRRGREHLGHGRDGLQRSSRNAGRANAQGLAQQDASAVLVSLQERSIDRGGDQLHQKP
jgi:hypothetical protein